MQFSFFIVCRFSIMEIKSREKWVAGFASVGKEKKILPSIQGISCA